MEIQTVVVGVLQANCYLVIDKTTKATAIVDPGDDPQKIIQAVADSQGDVKHILLTHGHPDHSFSAGELQKTYDVDVLMHESDVVQIEGGLQMLAMLYDISKFVAPRLGRFLSDGDVIKLGQTELQVIHTPGHTQGGLCFAHESQIITGDTLFADGVGRTDLPGGSHGELIGSIHEKLLTLPDDTVIYPGHGPISNIGIEREENPWIV